MSLSLTSDDRGVVVYSQTDCHHPMQVCEECRCNERDQQVSLKTHMYCPTCHGYYCKQCDWLQMREDYANTPKHKLKVARVDEEDISCASSGSVTPPCFTKKTPSRPFKSPRPVWNSPLGHGSITMADIADLPKLKFEF